MKVTIFVWPQGSDDGFKPVGAVRLVDGRVVADPEVEKFLADPIIEPGTQRLVHRADGEAYLRALPALYADRVRVSAYFDEKDDREVEQHVEVYIPADAADYLDGPMPTYSEKDDGHLFEFGGITTNMNELEPFDPKPKKQRPKKSGGST